MQARNLDWFTHQQLTCVAKLWGLPVDYFYEEGKKDDTSKYWLCYHFHVVTTTTGATPSHGYVVET